MVLVPREAGNVRLPKRVSVLTDHLGHLDRLLHLGQTAKAYRSGDRTVLIEQMGLSADDVDLIHHGVEVLTHWRTSARSPKY